MAGKNAKKYETINNSIFPEVQGNEGQKPKRLKFVKPRVQSLGGVRPETAKNFYKAKIKKDFQRHQEKAGRQTFYPSHPESSAKK